MKTAKEMFEKLGFRKNESVCYNNQHILYEKVVMNGTDILTIEFKDGYYVYTSSLHSPMKTYKDVHLAIHQQLIELGWIDDEATPKRLIETILHESEHTIVKGYKCPSCGELKTNTLAKYCDECGQRLEEWI